MYARLSQIESDETTVSFNEMHGYLELIVYMVSNKGLFS